MYRHVKCKHFLSTYEITCLSLAICNFTQTILRGTSPISNCHVGYFYCKLNYEKLQSQQFTTMALNLQLPEKRWELGARMATGCCSRRRGAMLQCPLALSEDGTSWRCPSFVPLRTAPSGAYNTNNGALLGNDPRQRLQQKQQYAVAKGRSLRLHPDRCFTKSHFTYRCSPFRSSSSSASSVVTSLGGVR